VLDAAIRGFKHRLQSHTDTEITEAASGDTGNEVVSPKGMVTFVFLSFMITLPDQLVNFAEI
jgi:hypothetical protein